ncbi:MAG: ATP-binding protein, partial [Planctomycetota bacterium]|nr:ATP-binding protein [Planctomycetota bacterium]
MEPTAVISDPEAKRTANGSEESEDVTFDAFEADADSYISKRELANRSLDTTAEVLPLSRNPQMPTEVKGLWLHSESHFVLGNDGELIQPLVVHLQSMLESHWSRLAADSRRVGLAIFEAIRNAIDHGNLELNSELRNGESEWEYDELRERRRRMVPYSGRQVYVTATHTFEEVQYVVRDEGCGFDTALLETHNPTDSSNIDRPSGRGIFLMKT